AHEGHDHSKVDVKVYYESLCRDSINFFKQQLTLPYYESFKDYMSLQFIPFGPVGKATQHGETECYGNIVQACAISTLYTEKDKMELISCLMTTLPDDTKTVTNQSYPTNKVSH
ncbi:GILT-like protein 1, partial [Blattella germanica]